MRHSGDCDATPKHRQREACETDTRPSRAIDVPALRQFRLLDFDKFKEPRRAAASFRTKQAITYIAMAVIAGRNGIFASSRRSLLASAAAAD
jgi:hypothetical protein